AQVHGHELVPVFGLRVGHRPEGGQARRGHQTVDSPAQRESSAHQRRDGGLLPHVGGHGERPAARRLDLALHGSGLARGGRGQEPLRAFAGERRRHGAADAPAPSRDEGYLAGEPHRMRPPRDLISSMNSARVAGRSRNCPSMAEITALEISFPTPRRSTSIQTATTTTATPRAPTNPTTIFATAAATSSSLSG